MFRGLFGYEDHEVEERERAHTQVNLQRPDLKVLGEGFGLPSMETIPYLLEPFLRRVVREEMEKIQTRFFSSLESGRRSSLCQIDGPTRCRWQLQFKSKLPHTLFTGSRIETDQNSHVQLAIVDAFTNDIVTSGPLASLKVDVVAINGDFCPDEQWDWKPEEFTSCILRQREGKPQLLTGDLVMTLDRGVGYLGDIYFTDNSSWIRSRKFRLGLRAQKCGSIVERVREGLSDAFLVKDHRGESYKKHHPPSPDDEVWRLEKIGKDGAFHRRLTENKICTVRDFLKHLVINQDVLRNILGNGMSNKIWEATVQHAWECEIEKKFCYSYHSVEPQVALYFDSIYRVLGVVLQGCHYESLNELSAHQKALVDQLKELAYQNQASMIEISNPMPSTQRPLWSLEDGQEVASSEQNYANSFAPVTQEGRVKSIESSRICFESQPGKADTAIGIKDWSDCSMQLPENPYQQNQNIHIQKYHSVHQEDFGSVDFCQYNSISPYISDCNTSKQEDDLMRDPRCWSFTSNLDLSRGLLHACGDVHHAGSAAAVSLPAADTRTTTAGLSKWFKLLTTLKCGMSIRKRVAAKRRARHAQVSLQMYSHLPNVYEGF